MNLADTAIGAIITAAITAAGFIGKRHFTKAPAREATSLYSDVADLMVKMRGAGISLAEVQAFEAGLRNTVRLKEGDPGPPPALLGNEPAGYWTQAQMNQRAAAELEVVDAQLDAALAELCGLLSADQQDAIYASHKTWLRYRRMEAELAASDYEGGSIQPLIRSGEASALTHDRLSRVRARIQDLRTR